MILIGIYDILIDSVTSITSYYARLCDRFIRDPKALKKQHKNVLSLSWLMVLNDLEYQLRFTNVVENGFLTPLIIPDRLIVNIQCQPHYLGSILVFILGHSLMIGWSKTSWKCTLSSHSVCVYVCVLVCVLIFSQLCNLQALKLRVTCDTVT